MDFRNAVTRTYNRRRELHIRTSPFLWIGFDQIPTALSRQANCKLETLAGTTVVGTVNKTFMVEVGASIRPTIGTFAATRVNNAVPSAWGVYVAGLVRRH